MTWEQRGVSSQKVWEPLLKKIKNNKCPDTNKRTTKMIYTSQYPISNDLEQKNYIQSPEQKPIKMLNVSCAFCRLDNGSGFSRSAFSH